MQTAVCAIAKLENNYIKEWVEYYLSIGFNKIILYDNNDLDGEDLSSPLSGYIKSGQVDIIDARGKQGYQVEAYNDCYQKYNSLVDWILFVDIDEFLTISSGLNINDFVSQSCFNNFNVINFQWCHYSDNGHIIVKNNNYSVLSRFTIPVDLKLYNYAYKFMIRTNIPEIKINSVHKVNVRPPAGETSALLFNSREIVDQLKYCNSNGETYTTCDLDVIATQAAYLKHFRYKTLQEYLELKIRRGYPMPFLDYGRQLNLTGFFLMNRMTASKIAYAKEWLEKSDLPEVRKQGLLEELKYLPQSGIPFFDE